jgi:hypothetical protein
MIETNQLTQREFEFELCVEGATSLSTETEDAIYNAGCDDATITMSRGQMKIMFTRSAVDLENAVISAIQAIHQSGFGLQVTRAEADNLQPEDIQVMSVVNSVLLLEHQRSQSSSLTQKIIQSLTHR